MPNFKMDSGVREDILKQVVMLTDRRMAYALADFPLTTAGVQCAILPEAQLSAIYHLQGTGYNNLPRTYNTVVHLPREAYPGLLRGAAVALQFPEQVHTAGSVYWYHNDNALTPDRGHDLQTLALEPDDRDAVTAWANGAVRELRLREATQWVANKVVADCVGTAHLLAAWPQLATLTTLDYWRNRFRQPVRSLKSYALDYRAAQQFGRLISGADIVLTGATLMEDYKPTLGTIQATVHAWERLPNDRAYS